MFSIQYSKKYFSMNFGPWTLEPWSFDLQFGIYSKNPTRNRIRRSGFWFSEFSGVWLISFRTRIRSVFWPWSSDLVGPDLRKKVQKLRNWLVDLICFKSDQRVGLFSPFTRKVIPKTSKDGYMLKLKQSLLFEIVHLWFFGHNSVPSSRISPKIEGCFPTSRPDLFNPSRANINLRKFEF